MGANSIDAEKLSVNRSTQPHHGPYHERFHMWLQVSTLHFDFLQNRLRSFGFLGGARVIRAGILKIMIDLHRILMITVFSLI